MANGNVYGGRFCSPDEKAICTIGSGYVTNFLSNGSAGRAGATLTDKRIYFSGTVFMMNVKGGLTFVKQRKIVNVRDVTGVGHIDYSPISVLLVGMLILVAGVISFLSGDAMDGVLRVLGGGGIVVGIVGIIAYISACKTLLSIEYAGGNIAFDLRWLTGGESDIFISNIHLAKDKLYSMSAVAQGFITEAGMDEYATDDEYECFCIHCGETVAEDATFCGKCGKSPDA